MMKQWLVCLLFSLLFILTGMTGFGQTDETALPDSLAGLLRENKQQDLERVSALAKVIDALFSNKEYQKARPFINEIIDLSAVLNNNYVTALGDYYLGSVLLTENNYKEALPILKRAKNLTSILQETDENLRLQIRIYSSLSVGYFKSQMFKDYYENIRKGLDLNKKLQDADLEFVLNSNLAVTYLYLGDDSAAIEIDKMLISDPKYADQNMFYPYFHLGAFNVDLYHYDTAEMYYKKAFSFVSIPEDASWVFLKMGGIFNIRGDYEAAIGILKRCLDTLSTTGNAEIEASAYIEMGNSYYKLLKYDTALSLIDKGIQIARQNHYLEQEVEGLGKKTDILYDLENYEDFAQYILAYNTLRDSLNAINNILKLSEMVFQQKVKEEQEQVKYNQYRLETKHRHQLLVIYIILLLLISTIVVVLLLLNRKNILIKNKKIQEELLSHELDLRNREMTAKVLTQVKRQELLTDIIKKLTDIASSKSASKNIQSIILELKQSLEDKSQEDFDYYFVQTHPDFYHNLQTDFPNLTPYELRLCAYLKMNLSTKDIASISNISPDSARTARSRLRKTLSIKNHDESLVNFLSKY